MIVRRVLYALCLLASVLVLIGLAAGVRVGMPIAAEDRLELPGSGFRVVRGAGAPDEDALQISGVGHDRSAVQAMSLLPVEAADYPILRYRFERFPEVLELSLLFRRADEPDEVHVITLPRPTGGEGSFTLSDLADWQGSIVEIGFAQFPTPQLVPASQRFEPFRLRGAQLWSPSVEGALAALRTDWFAQRPWGLFAVSSVDREAGPNAPRRPSLLLVVSATILLAGLWGLVWFGRRWRRIGALLAGATVAGWLVLDANWLWQLSGRLATTEAVYGGKGWPLRSRLVVDGDLQAASDRVKRALLPQDAATRVLVDAPSVYEALRLTYHLQPMNTALYGPIRAAGDRDFAAGAILVFYGRDDVNFHAPTRELFVGRLRFEARSLLDAGALQVFRVDAVEGRGGR